MQHTDTGTDSALVLFSGGQDSTTCLAWALERYARVETIGFDYGQRHAIELTVRPAVLAKVRAILDDPGLLWLDDMTQARSAT